MHSPPQRLVRHPVRRALEGLRHPTGLIALTEHGREAFARIRAERSQLLADRLSRISPHHRAALPVLGLLTKEPGARTDTAASTRTRRAVSRHFQHGPRYLFVCDAHWATVNWLPRETDSH
ncbi:hypothetical protein KCMC57_up01220 [Kitasatospora sp. CMC57]|uniref:Uncharacterized protein n=1 Tax=Kitasatospora sp. CMC57 TaxID=3231513 RepID=A0AB33JTN0_9ACTN